LCLEIRHFAKLQTVICNYTKVISKELKLEITTIISNNLVKILENNSRQEIDLDENEKLIYNLNKIRISKIENQIISIIEFKTSKEQEGYYKSITDSKGNLLDDFFVIK